MSGTGLTLPFVDASQENLDTLLQGLGVLLSAATIALALFLQWGLVRLRRPKLSLSVSANVDEEDWVPLDFADRAELYLRIRVHNERKKVTAHNVEVLLLKVQRPHHAKVAPVVPSRQLAWADTPDERLAIPSGTWRRVDVLKLTRSRNPGGAATLVPALKEYEPRGQIPPLRFKGQRWFRGFASRAPSAATTPQYATERDVLREDGTYVFELATTADEVEAQRWELSFEYRAAPASRAIDLLPQISQVKLEPIHEA